MNLNTTSQFKRSAVDEKLNKLRAKIAATRNMIEEVIKNSFFF